MKGKESNIERRDVTEIRIQRSDSMLKRNAVCLLVDSDFSTTQCTHLASSFLDLINRRDILAGNSISICAILIIVDRLHFIVSHTKLLLAAARGAVNRMCDSSGQEEGHCSCLPRTDDRASPVCSEQCPVWRLNVCTARSGRIEVRVEHTCKYDITSPHTGNERGMAQLMNYEVAFGRSEQNHIHPWFQGTFGGGLGGLGGGGLG